MEKGVESMEKRNREKFLGVLSLLFIGFSIIWFFHVVAYPPEPPKEFRSFIPPFSWLRLTYIDKNNGDGVYVFEVEEPQPPEIKECKAYKYSEKGRVEVQLQYTLIDICDNTTISTGDILLIHNITKYSGWKLWVCLHYSEPVFVVPSKIPDISNQTFEE